MTHRPARPRRTLVRQGIVLGAEPGSRAPVCSERGNGTVDESPSAKTTSTAWSPRGRS